MCQKKVLCRCGKRLLPIFYEGILPLCPDCPKEIPQIGTKINSVQGNTRIFLNQKSGKITTEITTIQ